MRKISIAIAAIAGAQLLGAQAHASDILKNAKTFQDNTSNIQNLMTVVGQARSLAIAGCPEAVDLIIRSYNAYLYHEKPGAASYAALVKQTEKCKSK